jgi:hypothetical protein
VFSSPGHLAWLAASPSDGGASLLLLDFLSQRSRASLRQPIEIHSIRVSGEMQGEGKVDTIKNKTLVLIL